MRERTVFAVLIDFQIPYNAGKQYDRRFHKEVALLLHPTLIEVEHDGVRALVSVRNILHEIRVYGIAAVAASRVIKVNYIELRLHLVSLRVVEQMVVGNGR